MYRPSNQELWLFSQEITPIVHDLLTKRIIHERVSAVINAECERILASGEYRYAAKWYDHMGSDRLPEDRIVRIVRDAYLMEPDDAARYYKLRADFVESYGWKCERDYCPASMAESRAIELENTLLSKLASLMKNENFKDVFGEQRKEALSIAMDLVTKLTTYVPPPQPTEWLGKAL